MHEGNHMGIMTTLKKTHRQCIAPGCAPTDTGAKIPFEFPDANGICGQYLRPPIEDAIKRLCNHEVI